MKIKATAPFTAFDGQMIVFNTGDVRDVSDRIAQQYIEAGLAVKAKSKHETTIASAVDERNPVIEAEAAPDAGDGANAGDEAPAS